MRGWWGVLVLAVAACGGDDDAPDGSRDGGPLPDAGETARPACRYETWVSFLADQQVANDRGLWMARIGDQPLGPAVLVSGTHVVTDRGRVSASSPDGRFVAFMTRVEDELLVVDLADGAPAEPRSISGPTEHGVMNFAWSPDSTQLAFRTDDGKSWLTRLADAPVRSAVGPTPPYFVSSYDGIAWSSDGRRVVHASRDPGSTRYTLYIESPDDAGETVPEPLAGTPLADTSAGPAPTWSGDDRLVRFNRAVAMQVTGDAIGEFWTVVGGRVHVSPRDSTAIGEKTTGLVAVDLTRMPPEDPPRRIDGEGTLILNMFPFAWAPDGRGAAYFQGYIEQEESRQLYFVFPAGSERVQLNTNLPASRNVQSFAWAPDSSALAYVIGEPPLDDWQLWLVRFDGTTPAPPLRLSINPAHDTGIFQVAWSPDGRRVAYMADQDTDGVNELFVVDVSGEPTPPAKVNAPLTANGDVVRVRWSPDGSRLAYMADQDTDELIEGYVVHVDALGTAYKINSPSAFGGDVWDLEWVACEPD